MSAFQVVGDTRKLAAQYTRLLGAVESFVAACDSFADGDVRKSLADPLREELKHHPGKTLSRAKVCF